ncbi:MAG: hypothetical protein JWP38_712 [Herbaspirillum sp.]|jgi:hypothetical protein|nr:hypothetical protein [Herbaspirillum sp.]
MATFLEDFYQHLGIEFPPEDEMEDLPTLVIDDQLSVCFSPIDEQRLQLICVVGPLSHDPRLLVELLDSNYSDDPDIVMAASEGSGNLLALAYACEQDGVLALELKLEKLVNHALACRSRL